MTRSHLRRGALLGFLGLALVALYHRSSIQTWAYGIGKETRQMIGKPAPELPKKLKGLDGPPVQLSEYVGKPGKAGKVVLLHFWTFD